MFDFITIQWFVEQLVNALLSFIISIITKKICNFLGILTKLFKKNKFDLTFRHSYSIIP